MCTIIYAVKWSILNSCCCWYYIWLRCFLQYVLSQKIWTEYLFWRVIRMFTWNENVYYVKAIEGVLSSHLSRWVKRNPCLFNYCLSYMSLDGLWWGTEGAQCKFKMFLSHVLTTTSLEMASSKHSPYSGTRLKHVTWHTLTATLFAVGFASYWAAIVLMVLRRTGKCIDWPKSILSESLYKPSVPSIFAYLEKQFCSSGFYK